jgi:O-antigen/teichoic acid export membrane protein
MPAHVARSKDRALEVPAVIRFAAHNYVGSLFLLGSSTLLPVVVTAELGATQTAFFYIAWTIAGGVQLVALSTTTSLMVELAFDESRITEYARRVVKQTLRIILPLAVCLLVAAPYVMRVFGPRYAAEGDTLLRLLAVAAIPNAFTVLGLAIARIRHDGRMVLGIQGGTFAGTLGLSLLLLPRVGIDGVGWAWLATQTAIALWLLGRSLRPVLFGTGQSAHPTSTPDEAR